MKAVSFLSRLFAVVLALTFAYAEESPAPDKKPAEKAPKQGWKDVSVDEAAKLLEGKSDVTVIDVRTPEEFKEGHIKGAVNLNVFDSDFAAKVAALDQTKPVLVHCQSGRRSSEAVAGISGKARFPHIYHLKEGFGGWKAAGKPVEKSEDKDSGKAAGGDKPSKR